MELFIIFVQILLVINLKSNKIQAKYHKLR